jgi:hypothetical protein
MELVSLIVAIISLFVAIVSLTSLITVRARGEEVSSYTYEALVELRKGIDPLDLEIARIQLNQQTSQTLRRIILEFKNNSERRIRRIALFTKDNNLVSKSLFWFMENAILEDRTTISRALAFKCIHGRKNKNCAKSIIQKIDNGPML